MTTSRFTPRRRQLLGAAAAGTLGMAWPLHGLAAKDFPSRPINLMLPFPAGGPTDVQMRALARAMEKDLGQPVLVVNQPGAAGTLAAANMSNSAAADGYTVSVVVGTLFRVPLLTKVNYKPDTDFTYIINLTGYTMAIAIRADSPWKTLDDLLEDARKRPGEISYGSTGVGSSGHVAMERLARAAGVEFNFIPFKGGAEESAALLGGHIDFISNAGWGPQVDAGRVRLLATYSSQRLKQRPDVPTLKELGYDLVIHSPVGVAGPKNLPADVTRRLHDAFRKAMDDPDYRRLIEQWDQEHIYMSTEEFTAYGTRQMAVEKHFLDELGIELK